MTALPVACFNNDKWDLNKIAIPTDYSKYSYTKSLNFKYITHPWLKIMAKEFVLHLINRKLSIANIHTRIGSLKHLSLFMELEHFSNLRDFTHKDTQVFIRFINTIHPTTPFLTRNLSSLSVFIQWGAWTHPEQFPTMPVIRHIDYPKAVRREPKYYTEHEMEKIKGLLPYTDKITARITLIMMYHGLRFSDISTTPITIGEQSCLTKTPDHQYIFEYYMSKTKRFNRIPVSEAIANVIQSQINSTRRKYGEGCNILFATDTNKGYVYTNYTAKINHHAKKHGLTYDDGRPLRINARMFRSTYATKLINIGASPDTVRAVLGHKQITTQIHYATIHGTTMVNLLAPLTKQDNDMILNIGNITESMCHIPDDYSDFIPLPNGACTCAGDCPHQNACYTCNFYIPQKEYLPTYRLQLEQAELAIKESQKYKHKTFMEKNIAIRDTLKGIITALEEN